MLIWGVCLCGVGAGAREESVSSMEEVYALLNRGSAVRTTSNTLMNEVGPPPNVCHGRS